MKIKKLLALLLCLCLVLPLCSAAFATGNEGDPTPAAATATPAADPAEPAAATPTPETPAADPAATPTSAAEPETPAADPTEAPACNCGAEGDAAHAETCPLYVAPTASTATPAAPADPTPAAACTCGATEEQKAADGFVHAEGCPLYVAPAFDVEAAYTAAMATQSLQELEAYAATLTEEQRQAVGARFSEADIRALAERFGISLEETIITPPKNYTRVGPLLPPVQVTPKLRLFRALSTAETENGLFLAKDAKANGDGTYTITMEAYTTGTVTSSEQSIPADIVLVLDESGSMKDSMYSYEKVYSLDRSKTYYVKSDNSYIEVNWCNGGLFGSHADGWYTGFHFLVHFGTEYVPMTSATDSTAGHVQFYTRSATQQTKNQALVAAAKAFVEKVYQDAVANDVDHRVSVIGFSGDNNASTKVGLVADIRDNRDNVNTAIDGLRTNGGTYIEDGMALAEKAFANAAATAATKRNRIVIVFTDGIPGTGTWNESMASANSAIAISKTLKSTGTGGYGATVYTIGLLDGADPTLEIIQENANGGKEDIARTNRFLHYLSSNYPDAASMTNGGSGSNKGYYLSASDTGSLEAIFKKIAEEIQTPTIDLGSETVVKDIISPYFTIPANTTDIKLYTEDYTGTAFDGTRDTLSGASVDIQGDTVSVTGFDFTENFVSNTAKPDGTFGKRLIIEFTVAAKEGFLGGNGVATNGAESGVYDKDGALVENFVVPTVDVPLAAVAVTAADKDVYLLGSLNGGDLLNGAVVTAKQGDNTYTIDMSKANDETEPYGLEPWQTEYVSFDLTADPAAGYTGLTDDKTFTLTATIKPTVTGTQSANSANATGDVHVYKPELTAADSTIYLGQTADYANNCDEENGIVWKHGTTVADTTTMGEAPVLSIGYNPTAGAFTQDTDVKMTTAIGESDVTAHTTFINTTDDHENGTDMHQFTVFVKTCSLTVAKKGSGSMTNGTETHIFTVTGPNGISLKIAVQGNDSKTIVGLPVGEYTVTEDTNWSWRYADGKTGSATLEASETGAHKTVTITNANPTTKWLSGDSVAINKFSTAGPTAVPMLQSAPAPAILSDGTVQLGTNE